MQEAELQDLADDADYAVAIASEKPAPKSITRMDSKKSEPDGAELVYLKDNVTIHPTQYASERISGRLRLTKQGASVFLTWIPYKASPSGADSMFQSSNPNLLDRDRSLYTIRAVPFTDVRSIRRHTPTLGWQYIIIVLSSGLAFPPLYFYNGGVREFLATLKQHVSLIRSADDANVFLVNDFQDPLQRSLSSLELHRALSIANSASTSVIPAPSCETSARTDDGLSIIQHTGRRQKVNDPARDISIQVLEKFSLVTKFARDTTSQLLREIQSDTFSANDRKNRIPAPLSNNITEPENSIASVSDEIPVAADPHEVDKISLVWGKPRQTPLGAGEWATFLDAEGRILDSTGLRKRIFYGGVEHRLRKEAWKFLLGYYGYDSTFAEREYLASVKKEEYETMKRQWQSITPAQAKRFTKFRERKGLIDKDVVRTDRTVSFYDGDDNPNVRILRDILLTYSFYNFDLGYCQGMSDLLSPILFVMKDEQESFWCFVALMERLGPNFNRDQAGMHSQLFALSKLVELLDSPLHNYFKQNDCLNYFFCFRWVLIQFKRELEYEETMLLWEVLWTHHLSEHLHLYLCVAILKRHRKKIMGEQMDFDTLLKFINELSGHIDLNAALRDAEALFFCAGENGEACIPPGTPPSLPAEDTSLMYSQQDDDEIL
ncbi:TBC1 domain family member 15-like [Papaver somniferum]|uniref:TBC1 domain family member 15-like n=1 Tax=Papaver somniferum TaxID=3469 RepID=UPI000E6F8502|nr:TBC1 domain family member 15-like [Papaver somniferum]